MYVYMEEKDRMIAKWAQEDVETLDNLLNNNNVCFLINLYLNPPLSPIHTLYNFSNNRAHIRDHVIVF